MAGNLTAMIAAAFAGGVVSDPYFEYTTLLLPGNGTNGAQNNTFLDSGTANSGSGFTITRNGNTTQGTFSPFSQTGWGNYFSGSSQYLTAPSNSAFNFSTNDFTIECWVYLTAYSANWSGSYTAAIISRDANTGASSGRNYWVNLNGTSSSWTGLSFGFFSGSTYSQKSESYAFSLNTWYNIAVVRSSGQVNFYVNGSVVGSGTTMSSAPNTNAIPLYIGQQGYSTAEYYFPGYISNLRLVNGVAVYTGNFTPPTSALTATQSAGPSGSNIQAITTGQTKLLTCQSNRFVDNGQGNTSNTPFTLTVYGTPSVQAFSPFNPTSSWSAVTNGGSGYFDGNGDYLTVASNAALQLNGEFTVEVWFYPLSLQTYDCLITTGNNSVSSNALGIFLKSNGGVQVYNQVINAVIFDTSSGVILNAWNHIAVTRNSSNGVDFWLNGVSQGATQTVSSNFASTTPTAIGNSSSLTQEFHGYIASTRIVKGIAVYTAAFTPPTAPLTATQSANTNGNPSAAITGTATSLLLNFTNAGIYDATSKNDLETVGNAQISTAQSKWGGSSMAFDGTSTTWLTIPDAPLTQLGSGDFTLETWFYANTGSLGSGVYVFLVDTRPAAGTATNSLLLYILSGTLTVQVAGTNLLTYSSFPTGQWVHIALSRASGTLRLFVNGSTTGVSPTSASNSTDISTYVRRIGVTYAQNLGFINGYLQDFRITKGYARYTTNFTPPTSAFPTL